MDSCSFDPFDCASFDKLRTSRFAHGRLCSGLMFCLFGLEAVSKLNFRYERLQFTLTSLSAQNPSST
jgi:hypothetical protein